MRRTGPETHTPKSLASLSWPSRPYRASGQPSCGKRLQPHTRRARHRRLESRAPVEVRTSEQRCSLRGATAELGPRADFLENPCGPTANQGNPTRYELHPRERGHAAVHVRERGQRGDCR